MHIKRTGAEMLLLSVPALCFDSDQTLPPALLLRVLRRSSDCHAASWRAGSVRGLVLSVLRLR